VPRLVDAEGSVACERKVSTQLTKWKPIKQHTYAQRVVIILVLGILALSENIKGAVFPLLWVFRQVM
jgi:hypothetical protein